MVQRQVECQVTEKDKDVIDSECAFPARIRAQSSLICAHLNETLLGNVLCIPFVLLP